MKLKKSLLKIPFLLALLTTQAFASYYIPDNGVTTAKIKDAAVTRAKLATGSNAKLLYVTASTDKTVDSTLTDVLEMTCSAACTITLPTAVGIQGYELTIIHNGTQLVPMTLHTASSQTVGGIADNTYKLWTIGERITIFSDNANWKIRAHGAKTGWISAGNFNDFFTFTITTGSATNAATYVPAWVFTVTAANATVASTYTNNGVTCTTAATIASQTTLVMTCPGTPLASGTLTKSGGTGDSTITFSAKAGNPSSTATFTIVKTLASGTTLIADSLNDGQNASGRLVKASGTGDAVIVYSSYTGAKNVTTSSTATRAIHYGSPSTNSRRWRRDGHFVVFEDAYYQTVAGPVAGTNDMLIAIPAPFLNASLTIDTTDSPIFSTGTGDIGATAASHDGLQHGWINGSGSNGSGSYIVEAVTPYSSTQIRIWGALQGTANWTPFGASILAGNQTGSFRVQYELPISTFQP